MASNLSELSFGERLIRDTIKMIGNNAVWASDNKRIPKETLDAFFKYGPSLESDSELKEQEKTIVDTMKMQQDFIKEFNEIDYEYISQSEMNKLKMRAGEIFNKDLDNISANQIRENVREGYRRRDSGVDNLGVKIDDFSDVLNPKPSYRHAGYEDLSEDIYSLMSAMSPEISTPWLENDDRSVTTLGGERDRHDFRRDFGDFTNFLGLGPQVGQDIGTGVHRLSSFLDYYLNPF